MRLRTRLIILIGAAAVIPLGILGLGAINVSVDRLTRKAADSQARSADQMASEIDLWLQFQVVQELDRGEREYKFYSTERLKSINAILTMLSLRIRKSIIVKFR